MAKSQIIVEKPSPQDLQEYIIWALTQDESKNPLNDPTGERAARNQGRYGVWFIPGGITNENKITRECTVPSKTEILILAATSDSSYLEHKEAQNDDQLLAIAKEIAKLHKNVEIRINQEGSGEEHTFRLEEVKSPKKDDNLELIEKPAFPIIFPENNIYKILYGVKGGFTHLAVVAWGIKVKLEPGKYKLILKAQHDAADISVPNGPGPIHAARFNLDIEYTLTAIAEKGPLSPFARYVE